jgi:tetratricopeptide (TPR) repeat protein
MARLNHPNVVTVHEVGAHKDQVFIAMEYVEGQTLRGWLRDDRSWKEVVSLFLQAGRGVAAAHAADLVHRDFKPDNVLVGNDGRARVADFGLVLPVSGTEASINSSADVDTDAVLDMLETVRVGQGGGPITADLTRSGALLGTPAYMAPEQLLRQAADARADQYAFCVALYEALYLKAPHATGSFRELVKGRLSGEMPARVRGRGPSTSIHRILERGLSREPGDRYPSMDALLADLEYAARPRRRAWMVAGALALAGGASLTALFMGGNQDLCATSTEAVQAVWNDARKQKIHQAFTASDAPFADDAYERAVARLDGFAAELETHHRAACEAMLSGGDASTETVGKQMLCLGQRLRQMDALTDRLARADAKAVGNAAKAAGELESVATCADDTVLATWDPSMSADLRARLEDIDRAIAVARSSLALGHYSEGLAALEGQEEAAERAGHLSSHARVLELRGALLAKTGELEQAEQTLRTAVRLADEARDDATRAWAWVRLVRVVGYDQARYDDGLALAEDARAAARRLGDTPAVLAVLYNNMGSIANRKGDYPQAVEHHNRALEIRREQLGEDHAMVAVSLHNLGNVQTAMGNPEQAQQTHRKALATFERTLGPNHPNVGSALHNLANALLKSGDHAGAIETSERALKLRIAVHGEHHRLVGMTLNSLGEAQLAAGNAEAALTSYQRAVAVKEETLRKDHPSLAFSLTGVGKARLELQQASNAVAPLERALAIHDAEGSAPEEGAEAAFALARALAATDAQRSAKLAQRALAGYAGTGQHATELAAVTAWTERLD